MPKRKNKTKGHGRKPKPKQKGKNMRPDQQPIVTGYIPTSRYVATDYAALDAWVADFLRPHEEVQEEERT